MNDIQFAPGDSHVLVIDTNQYSGNFERQLAAYVIGAYDEDRYHGKDQLEAFNEAAHLDHRLKVMNEKVCRQLHIKYGMVSNTIWPTPNRINAGLGVHRGAQPGEKGWPAYESVAVFLKEPLTEEELGLVKEWAEAFEWMTDAHLYEKLEILNVRQVKVTTAAFEFPINL